MGEPLEYFKDISASTACKATYVRVNSSCMRQKLIVNDSVDNPPPPVEEKSTKSKKRKPEIVQESAVKEDDKTKSNVLKKKGLKTQSPDTENFTSNTTSLANKVKKKALKKKIPVDRKTSEAVESNITKKPEETVIEEVKPAKRLKKAPKTSPQEDG